MAEITKGGLSIARESNPPLGKDNLLSVFEISLEPFVLVMSLWAVAIYFDGELSAPYLILSVLLFAITFPGTPRLGMAAWQVVGAVALSWAWTASLLVLTGVATGYEREFSRHVIFTWLASATPCSFMPTIMARRGRPCKRTSAGAVRRNKKCPAISAKGASTNQVKITWRENSRS